MALAGVAGAADYTLTTVWEDLPNTVADFYSGDFEFTFTLSDNYTIENSGAVLGAYFGTSSTSEAGACAIVLNKASNDTYTLTIGRGKLSEAPSNAEIALGTTFTPNTSYSADNGNPNTVTFENVIKKGITYTLSVTGGNHNMQATLSWDGGSSDTLAFSGNMVGGNAGQFMNYAKNNGVSNVPEPTTATLSLLALAGLAARRRRR